MAESYADDPDVALMLSVAAGDRSAFEKLVTKYQKIVINTAFRYTGNPAVAEDLAQDVFVRMYRAASAYRPEARFRTWLFTIVRNVCFNYRKRQGKQDQQVDHSVDPSFSIGSHNPEEDLIQSEKKKKVREAIGTLPESLRLPLILHQFDHMSYDEIGKVMEISLATVKVRIHRARLALMKELRSLV